MVVLQLIHVSKRVSYVLHAIMSINAKQNLTWQHCPLSICRGPV